MIVILEDYDYVMGIKNEDLVNFPVLDSNLLDILIQTMTEIANSAGDKSLKFYTTKEELAETRPSHFVCVTDPYTVLQRSDLTQGNNLIVMTTLVDVLVHLNVQAVMDKPNTWFLFGEHRSRIGYFTTDPSQIRDVRHMDGNVYQHISLTTLAGYVELCLLTQNAVGEENRDRKILGGVPMVYGSADIVRSEVYGPCFIGPEVTLINSTVYPGTYIYGKVEIKDSEVKGCVIIGEDSYIQDSTLHDSVLDSFKMVKDITLSNSKIVKSTVLNGTKKR